jgi:hypothetical protein
MSRGQSESQGKALSKGTAFTKKIAQNVALSIFFVKINA